MIDSGQKFVISPIYSLPTPEEIFDLKTQGYDESEDLIKLKDGALFILLNKLSNKLFLINPTIYFFLKSFREPTTLENVSHLFAKEANCSVDQIAEAMNSFMHRMQKRNVLIKEEEAAKFDPARLEEKPKESYAKFVAGQKFKEYTVHSLLSIRKESQLYLLEDENKQIWVLKITFLHPDIPPKFRNEIKTKFSKEFEMLDELKGHPAICELKDYDDSTNQFYGIMEYVDGVSLRKYVTQNDLTLQQSLHLIGSVLDIINYIQSKGILHGDIHNSNFMVNKDGSVKIIDFGLSNHVAPDEDEILRNGGKNSFIPPERISLNSFTFLTQRADYTSEVFQLGVLAYFILFKEMPFKGFTWKALAHQIMTQEPNYNLTPSNNEESLSDSLIAVLKKSMAKNPADRFESAATFLEAFNEVRSSTTTKVG